MRYIIIETHAGYKLVDINKGGIVQQERYVLDPDGIVLGMVVESFSDPLEAISDLIILQIKETRKQLMEEIKNARY